MPPKDNTDDFTQNFRIQGKPELIPLDESNIEAFIEKHGYEQAIGYMRAVRDFIHELEFAAYDLHPLTGHGNRPITRVKNNIDKLLLHKENFLKQVIDKQYLKPNVD